ncbi:phosphatase PAP2/dual specificity phosphatase family protein [Schlegelella sp. S2-27]|uniref:Phosphatase PAP2/dual specificity phosphatase family protein n=1 Tax=Caldimonas mangrovi TaxID=2944811 RepID=A0ABT0YUN3_9BURK|nr:phosphatase PAP2/dual specificity phosphatase family protein [Caldimonas mangrovi]MCM5681796.1 phosphatase PAP2/dual specificity phosphatase family protein [Caldimonas mangrovi]
MSALVPALSAPGSWARSAAWLAALAPFFYLSYGLSNHLAAQRADVPSLAFAWEQHLPFLAWTILPYWSLNAFYGLSLFVARSKHEIDAHGCRLLVAQLFAVACFLLWPLQFTFERPASDGWAGWMFAALTSFDQPYNQAPSLHIALMVILWSLYTRVLRGAWRWAFHAWFTLIGVSVLTTYQHHFIDIPAGLWLGWLCVALFPLDLHHRDSGWATLRSRPLTPRRVRLAVRYGAGGVALLVAGIALVGHAAALDAVPASAVLGLAGIVLCWSAGSALLICSLYLCGDPWRFQKSESGRMSMAARWLLGPYLAAAWLNSRWWTRRDAPRAEVAPGVWLSRLPRARELAAEPHTGIVDLCAELPLPLALLRPSLRVPVLDLTAPTAQQLREAVQGIERLRAQGPVWVCCALGYARSASAVAAWLLATGRAKDKCQAHALLHAARPRVRLGPDHWDAIVEAAETVCLPAERAA